jgi:hypothetical protein
MRKTIGVTTFLLASAAALDARADTVNWNEAAYQFDNGARPAVVLGTGGVGDEGPKWEVEAHEGGNGDLWYSWGWAAGMNAIRVGGATREDAGYAPALASAGPTPNNPLVVEVHQGTSGFGPLWGHVAVPNGPIVTFPSFSFENAHPYDNGYRPAVAATPVSTDESVVIEVHQGQTGAGPLWFHIGSVFTGVSPPSLAWQPDGEQYDWGEHPSVAVTQLPSTYSSPGIVVVEVHQGGDGFGPLWYRTGTFNPSNWTMTWNASHPYDNGVAPAVAVVGNRVIEVHQGTNGFGPLWYHEGYLSGSGIVWEANAHPYDNGYVPAVAWNTGATMGLEVHQGQAAVGPLWQHAFTTQAAVPYYPEAEGDWCWLTSTQMIIDSVLGAYEDPSPGNPGYATSMECSNANLEQEYRGGWGANGAFVDCCQNISYDSTGPCNRPGNEANVFADHGIVAPWSTTPASFGTLQGEIAAGRPVGFDIKWNDGSGQHMEVVTGTEVDSAGNQWVLVNDPKPAYEYEIYSYTTWSNRNSKVGDFTLVGQYTNVHR